MTFHIYIFFMIGLLRKVYDRELGEKMPPAKPQRASLSKHKIM